MSLESVFKLSLVMNMIDNLTGPMAGVTSKVSANISALDAASQTFGGMAKAGAVMREAGSQIVGAVLAPVEATFATRRALGELASLGVRDLEAIEDAARSFSDQWAGTSKADFITAAYDIKSGIASLTDEGVAGFTELAGLTAKATKSTVGEMTSLFATGYGIYKDFYSDLSDLEFGQVFSAGIASSVKQFKTTGSGMAQAIQSLGASATTAQVPLEEQLSVLGMLQATMSGSEAGTKYKAFLRSAAKGGEALGLTFTDANNQLLSMPEILDRLRGKFGETMDAAEKMELQKAFGDTEAVALIDLMYSKVGDLQDNIVGMYDSLGSGTGVAREMASAIQETEPERFERLRQRIQNVTETIGNSLLPTVNDLMSRGEEVLTKTGAWIEQNQELVRIIMTAALAIGGFLTVGGTAITVISSLGLVFTRAAGLGIGFIKAIRNIPDALDTIRLYGMFAGDAISAGFTRIRSAGGVAVTAIRQVGANILTMARNAIVSGVAAAKNMAVSLAAMAKQAVVTAVTALPGLISSVWSFTTALLANPITWIIVGIVALVAALILLWRNWDAVSAFLQNAWSAACGAVSAGIDRLKQGFQAFLIFFQSVRTAIVAGIEDIKGFFNSITQWIEGKITWFGEAGKRLITTFVNGIRSVAESPVNAVKGIFNKLGNLFPHSDAKEGPLSTLTLSGQRTMTTYAHGLDLAGGAPTEAMEKSFGQTRAVLEREPVKKVSFGGSGAQDKDAEGSESGGSGGGKNIIIQKLLIPVDLKKIKDLEQILSILKEIEDFTNGNGVEDPSGDSDAVPSPA